MIFSKFRVKIKEKPKQFILEGYAWGEKLKKEHNIKTEVKGATYSQLEVKKNKEWLAQCIVDV